MNLTLVASPTTVRILDGSTEIASHRRSYDRRETVEDPSHRQALLEEKRKALGSTPSGRLAALIPESQAFLQAAFERGESAARLTVQLLHLLDDWGAAELATALHEALEEPHPAPLFRGLYLGSPPSPIPPSGTTRAVACQSRAPPGLGKCDRFRS